MGSSYASVHRRLALLFLATMLTQKFQACLQAGLIRMNQQAPARQRVARLTKIRPRL